MKITDVKFLSIEIPLDKPIRPAWEPSASYDSFPLALIRIYTDEGIVGNAVELTPEHVMGIARSRLSHLKSMLIGTDPFGVEQIMNKLRYAAFVGPKPWAIEIALWDIIGKACGQPVYRLLGGAQNRVKAYLSTLQVKSAEEHASDALMYFEQGFRAVKLRAHRSEPSQDLEVVAAVRDAVGPEMDIMVDANQAWPVEPPYWSFHTALWMAKELSALGVVWLEEPLPKDDLRGLARLAEQADIPIAGGELEWGIHRFRQMMEAHAYDIVQPDPHWCGGILEARKISILAEAMNKQCVLHTGGIGGLWLAANLQVAGSIPDCRYFEYILEPPVWTLEMRDILLAEPIMIDDEGYLPIPQGPGLGVDLDEEAVAKCTVCKA
ncbi:MAG: mandelate racemase/muconate lactonizing enzyme family protein [Rhodospirillales bacterium]|nr:mandelate racemase/muconate lactonizing enzyme family protein [Rhodospirillales bacterium]